MKKILFLVFVFSITYTSAQVYRLNTDLTNAYLNETDNRDIIIETKLGDDTFYEIKIIYKEKSELFKLKPLTYPNFEAKFKDALKKVIKANGDALLKSNIGERKGDIAQLFAQIATYHNSEDEQPVVANIYLKNDKLFSVYCKMEIKKIDEENDSLVTFKTKILEINSVEISFYGGFIEKIQVQGSIDNTPITFNNKYSIGISSTKNIGQLSYYRLFSDEKFDLTQIKNFGLISKELSIKNNKQYKVNNKKNLFIKVDEIIRYVKKVDVNANDISPVPQLLILDKTQKESKLYREKSSKLFETVVYTDFFGLFDEENPNGIIQTEINKRFNLNTKRSDVNKKFGFLFPPFAISEGYGFLQYFDAKFQYSKIESDSKFVIPETFENSNDTISYYSPLSLIQNRSFSIGGNLNLLALENQNSKLNMFFDVGFHFGRTGIKDSINDDSEGFYTNNLEIPIEFKFHILPEKRVSFSLSDRLSWFETFDSDINLKSIEDDELTNKNRWLNSFNVGINVDISSSGKLFLRYKLTHELDNINNNFSRLQFGYSFYLLKSNGVKKRLK